MLKRLKSLYKTNPKSCKKSSGLSEKPFVVLWLVEVAFIKSLDLLIGGTNEIFSLLELERLEHQMCSGAESSPILEVGGGST